MRHESLYAEAAYFDNEQVQHCAARDEDARLTRKRELARQIADAERNAKMRGISASLPPWEQGRYLAKLDAILSLPKLRREMKSLEGEG
jgi:hypothetical protein